MNELANTIVKPSDVLAKITDEDKALVVSGICVLGAILGRDILALARDAMDRGYGMRVKWGTLDASITPPSGEPENAPV